MKVIKRTALISGLRGVLWWDEKDNTYTLSLSVHWRERTNLRHLGMDGFVLDEFGNPALAFDMLDMCEQWIGSKELVDSCNLDTADAVVESWQEFSLRNEDEEVLEALAEMQTNPLFGMF